MVFQPGYCDRLLAAALGVQPRRPDEPLRDVHFDIAAALQERTQDVLFHFVERLRELSEASVLCLAGGVFQNSVANGKILRCGLFDHVHVPPVPGDHGGAFGSAAVAAYEMNGLPRSRRPFSPFSGPGYGEEEMAAALGESGLPWSRPDDVVEAAAELLAGDRIVGWFQGRAEYGPRAFGHRSILASPRDVKAKDAVNDRIKHRESFRPFEGAVPVEVASRFFELKSPSPFMQFVVPVRTSVKDDTPQSFITGRAALRPSIGAEESFWRLLHAFGRRTGVPVLLNTSFKRRGRTHRLLASRRVPLLGEDASRRSGHGAVPRTSEVVERTSIDRDEESSS